MTSAFTRGADSFNLSINRFANLQSTDGVLNADNFVVGAGAVASTADQHIIFSFSSGTLYHDATGSDVGAQDQRSQT